jgi:hypothetical protein
VAFCVLGASKLVTVVLDLDLGVAKLALPVVTDPAPVVTWQDPTVPAGGAPITGYNVGIRDLAATGTAVGTYPNTAAVSGASSASEALSLLFQSGSLVAGHGYAVAIQTLAATPPGPSAWSSEYQFLWQPLTAPPPPGSVIVT